MVQKKIHFGTDGIRGNSDKFPFTKNALIYLGKSIAKWSINKYKKNKPTVLIGHDTRMSCSKIKKNLIKGLMSCPLNIIDAQVIPTPAVCKLIKIKKYDFGIVISASHNTYKDNGIKIFDSKKSKLTKNDEQKITNNFYNFYGQENENCINKNSIYNKWPSAKNEYIKSLLSYFPSNLLKNKKIVLDCANGSTYQIAPEIFTKLGAQIITMATSPDGQNINKSCGALHAHLLKETIIKNKADIGFAFDGDGDRVIALNKHGEIKNGDDILALLCNSLDFQNTNTIVGTIMTNLGLENFLKTHKKELIRTPVGDKYIAAKLEKDKLLLGGESSGHIIMKNYINTGDGIFNAVKVLEEIIRSKNWEFKTFTKTPQYLVNLKVKEKKNLNNNPFCQIIAKYKNLLKNGRIIVRYSGTENLLRIMTEAKNNNAAKLNAQNLSKELEIALNKS